MTVNVQSIKTKFSFTFQLDCDKIVTLAAAGEGIMGEQHMVTNIF